MNCRAAVRIIAMVVGAVALPMVVEANEKKINVNLNFTIEGWHGPWFLAKERGYFSEVGLDVNIQRGYGSVDTVKKVLTGATDVGFADPVPIIRAVADGQPIKAIMGGYMKEPCALYSVAEHANVRSPKEMEGKAIGGNPGDICIVLLQPVMEKLGADFSKVTLQSMDAPTRIPLLATGRLDTAASFYEKEVLFGKAIKAAGKTMVAWRFDEYINKYSVMVVVGPKMLTEKGDATRKLVLALLRGYQDHLKDPDAGAAAIMKAHPEFDRDYIYASARSFPENAIDETARAKGIGILDREKMRNTIELTARYWKLPRKPEPDEIFTNDFIEAAHRQLKK
jgi:NitT/TauT family transport system substrate-binding protein